MKKLVLVICGVLIFTGVASAKTSQFDDIEAELELAVPAAQLSNCAEALVPIYDIETLNFFEFLDSTFKSKNSTDTMVSLAIARYSEYKKKLKDVLETTSPASGGLQDQEFQSFRKCTEITETYLKMAKQRMISHIKSNSAQKKTTILVEKYQAIDERLRKTNFAIAEMNAFFQTFKNRLPGFIRKCVVK